MSRLWRIFWRSAAWEWRAISRSRIEQIILFWIPALTIALVWYTFSASQVNNLPIGVLDKDQSVLSRKLINMVNASPKVSVTVHYRNAQEMQTALRDTEVYGVLVIPQDFSQHIRQVETSPVQLVTNGQYGTHSGVVQSGVGTVVRTFSAGVELSLRKKMGMSDKQARIAMMPIKPDTKMAFNLSLSYQQFLASAIIPALLHILATVVGVGAIGRELREKSIGKWFFAVCRRDYKDGPTFLMMLSALVGKLFWQMVAFSLWINITLSLIARVNHLSLSSLSITALNAWMLMILSLWLGVILTTLVMSKRMGLSNAGIITAPAFAYSGITYPIVAMPKLAQSIAALLPLTHYLRLQIAQIQVHSSWKMALPTTYGFMLAIIFMAILATLLTLLALKRKHRWGGR